MALKEVILKQYGASLEMLRLAVEQCPENLWDDAADKNRFWHLAYHCLFYTHLYLQDNEGGFKPWEKHKENSAFLDHVPWPPFEPVRIQTPYNKTEVLEYLGFCVEEVPRRVLLMNLEGESGFPWYPISKLEHQFVNIRHIQHHTGQLMDRLRSRAGIGIDWIGTR